MRFLVVGTKDVPVVKHFSITRLETQESSRKPLSLKRLTEGLKPTRSSEENEIYKIFTNVMCLHPPKEEDPLRVFNKQIDEDRRIVISRSNINELQKILLQTLDLRNWTWSRVEVKANYEDPGRVTPYVGHSLIPWKGNKLISIAGHSKDASEVINGPLEIRIAASSLDNPPPDLYLGSFHAGDDVGSPKEYLGSAAVQKTTGADVAGSLFCPFCC
ncbi:acyl-CoA-binding domain-containing protein 4 isoform X2 [Helianthus annuus]|uniref:acyl-CoA-binding domain-containing protein 4-like isoform X2 n=1 Tax=Helianthus annuus TaxID=4232 RepID=UPI001652C54B|nr:acyl-CoA-binding domain-containing protein 4-like isoform X2 [Helianthus annuus]XP_035845594.1 acyl-CoA-binding domain-containing protein 4 isoform X2 [Helianthus annuus]